MRKQKLFFLILVVGFLLFQSIGNANAESCIKELKITVAVYETQHTEDDSKVYLKSPYQPSGTDKFVRRSDMLFIESVYAEAKHSCNTLETLILTLTSPTNKTKETPIYLNFSQSNIYSFELKDKEKFYSIHYVDFEGNEVSPVPNRLTLSEEGLWAFELSERGLYIWNDEWILPGEILVMDRLAITQLETLRQIRGESERNTFVVFVIGFFTIVVGLISIRIMKQTSKEQIKKMDDHYKEQTKKEDKREEEKQLSLLNSLYSELCAIGDKKHKFKLIKEHETVGNLHWFKELLGWEGILPGHGIWYLTTSLYIGLNKEIKGVNTASLKKMIIFINQKIDLINNHVVSFGKDKNKDRKEFRGAVIKIIDEAIGYVKEAKEFIEKEFDIKPSNLD